MQPTGKMRFENFSDGVFAIAITLLALELHVPQIEHTELMASLHELAPLIPSTLTFILSFITIAILWVNHHQLSQNITAINKRRILWANIGFLMFVTLTPFATQAVSGNPLSPLAVLLYALVLCGGSVSFTFLRYFIHKGCGETSIPMGRSLIGPIFYLLAVLMAPWNVIAAYILLAIPPLFYFLPKGTNHEQH